MHYCPNCNKSNFRVLYSTEDLVYRPIIIKEGKIVCNEFPSTTKHMCQCVECGENFTIEGSLLDKEEKYE